MNASIIVFLLSAIWGSVVHGLYRLLSNGSRRILGNQILRKLAWNCAREAYVIIRPWLTLILGITAAAVMLKIVVLIDLLFEQLKHWLFVALGISSLI